jgi:probable HAF family extracellular repeat protein
LALPSFLIALSATQASACVQLGNQPHLGEVIPDAGPRPANRTPLILIHGWNPFGKDVLDSPCAADGRDTWDNFIAYYQNDTALNNAYQLYSRDGSVVAGFANDGSGAQQAVQWVNGTISPLGFLPGDTASIARGVSADGTIIVGSSAGAVSRAVRWAFEAPYLLGFPGTGSNAPFSYADAIANMLGAKDFGFGNAFGAVAAASGGRKIASMPITHGSILADGLPVRWAVMDDANSRLLATGRMSGAATVANGGTFTLDSFEVVLPAALSNASLQSFSTNFPSAEDPISVGGKFITSNSPGVNWTALPPIAPVRVASPGLAESTRYNIGPDEYGDALAVLTGTWSPDQSASVTVGGVLPFNAGSFGPEFEIHLRTDPVTGAGYEITWGYIRKYYLITRWYDYGGWTPILDETPSTYQLVPGDVLTAKVVGNTITMYTNGVQVAQVTDSYFTTGNPGFGFNKGGGNADEYGISSFSAWEVDALNQMHDTHDFNGDGKSDILWRNTNGDVAIWLMNGLQALSAADIGNVPTSWSIVGTGDFNGDGKSDILWRNTNGDVAIWLMNGLQALSATDTGNVPTSWSIVGTGDLNGDGYSDILWRNTNGDVAIWLMNGLQALSAADIGNVPTVWTLQSTNADANPTKRAVPVASSGGPILADPMPSAPSPAGRPLRGPPLSSAPLASPPIPVSRPVPARGAAPSLRPPVAGTTPFSAPRSAR